MKVWTMNVRLVAPVAILCCLAFATQPAKAQQTFSYADFTSTSGITLNGTAAGANNGTVNVLRLTPGAINQLGTAFYGTPISVTNGFTTTFTFQFSGQGGDEGHADGIAFVVQNAPAGATASGVLGGSIGYGDDDSDDNPTAGISNSVAIEFDTFDNAWDPNNNHVAIQSCGTGNNTQHHGKICPGTTSNSTLALNSTIATDLTDGSQHIVVINYAPPCANCLNLTVMLDSVQVMAVALDISTLGLGANGTAYVGFTASTGDGFENQDVLTWDFSSQTITLPVSATAPTTFNFSTVQGSELTHTVDFAPPSGGGLEYPLGDPTTIQIQSTNIAVNSTTWPQYVTGGPLAPSILFPMVDDNTGGVGTNGGLFVDLCFDPTLSGSALIPSDANCPFYPSGSTNFLGINVVADLVTKPLITAGTTSVLAHYEPNTTGTTTWSPSPLPLTGTPNAACGVTLGSPSGTQPSPPTDCDVLDIQQAISGDQTTSSGRSRGKGTFAFAYNVPMLLSTVSVNGTQLNNPPNNNNAASAGLWFSAASAPLSLSFLVNPACPPGSTTCPVAPSMTNNFFSAAPVAGETFDVTTLGGTSVVGTTTGTPPVGFTTSLVQPVTFTGSLTEGQLPDGQYLLQWSALDNVGIPEQNQQLVPAIAGQTQCPDGSPVSLGGACYITNQFSAQLNVDSTRPTITPTFTPSSTGNIFAVGSSVVVNFGCADNLSGVATCQSTGVAGLTNGGAINTASSQVGTHTFTITATDKAGNAATPQVVSYQIVASSELVLLNVAKPTVNLGSNLTYNIAVLNLGPAVADNVVVTDTLPAGTSFVSAGYGTVSCTLSGCSEMNGLGSACTLSSNTVTCFIPTVGLLLKSLTGAVVNITVNVNTATAGTVLTDTATGKAANTNPIPALSSATARTEVCSSTGSCPKLH